MAGGGVPTPRVAAGQPRGNSAPGNSPAQPPRPSDRGVCFRMLAASAASSELEHLNAQYTEEEARKLGVVGWVKNTSKGTVTGQVQGPEEKVNAMKSWLTKVGSPSSRIDRTNFSNEKEISKLDFSGFSTRY
ncbi:acylphosphatase-2 isoform X1 [Apteryx mantelli]|uniref:Acylphosphatase-2 n=1 Tax=Apteryx mantelli TaxID=2696672 RepID=A0ABM4E8R5_9AVES